MHQTECNNDELYLSTHSLYVCEMCLAPESQSGAKV